MLNLHFVVVVVPIYNYIISPLMIQWGMEEEKIVFVIDMLNIRLQHTYGVETIAEKKL